MKKLLILVCSLVFLTSCLPGHSLNPTITPSLTPTAASTKIPTATPTNTPTVIPTITPTPTPQLPVTLDKPLPEVSDAIGVENASQLNLIANYERFDIGKTLLKLTPDGNYYFIVSDGGAVPLGGIDVYDSNTKQIIRHYSINQRQIYDRSVHHNIYLSNDLQMSKDGQRFMVRTNDNSLSVFDDAGKNIFSYTPPPKIDSNPALSPNGRYLAIDLCSVCFDWTGGQMAFKVFNLDTGEMIYERISIKKNGEVYGSNPLFSPDGKFLATRIGSMEYIWDTSDWSEISNIDLGVSSQIGVIFSPDSELLATAVNGTVTFWNIHDQKEIQMIHGCGDENQVTQMAFVPDSSIIALLNCGTLGYWKISDGTKTYSMDTSFRSFDTIRMSNEGAPSFYEPLPKQGVVYAPWEPASLPFFRFVDEVDGYRLNFVAYTSIFFGYSDLSGYACTIRFTQSFTKPGCEFGSASWNEATQFLMGNDGEIYRVHRDFNTHQIEIRRGMTADSDLLFSFTYNGRYGGAFAIDPSERLLFYEITNHIPRGNSYVMDMETNRNLQTWPNMTLPDNQFTYSHDGKLAAFFLNAFNGTQMIVYDLANQRTIYWAFKPYMNVYGADFSLDGKYLAHFFYGENDTNPDFFYIMDVTNPYRATRFSFQRIPGQWPTAISYSPLGTTIAIGFSGGITCMFDSAKGTMLNEWQSNNTQIKALAFTPDGKFLATASEEGAIRLWGIYP